MSDAEFIARAESILQNVPIACRHLLELVDVLGQGRAFNKVNDDLGYPRELMVRMLHAANSPAGVSETELFSIAVEMDKYQKLRE